MKIRNNVINVESDREFGRDITNFVVNTGEAQLTSNLGVFLKNRVTQKIHSNLHLY